MYTLLLAFIVIGVLLITAKGEILPPPPPPPSELSTDELGRYEKEELKLERKLEKQLRQEEEKLRKQRLKLLRQKTKDRIKQKKLVEAKKKAEKEEILNKLAEDTRLKEEEERKKQLEAQRITQETAKAKLPGFFDVFKKRDLPAEDVEDVLQELPEDESLALKQRIAAERKSLKLEKKTSDKKWKVHEVIGKILPGHHERVDTSHQKKELKSKLKEIRGAEKKKLDTLEKSRYKKNTKEWLLEHRKKELEKHHKRKELIAADDEAAIQLEEHKKLKGELKGKKTHAKEILSELESLKEKRVNQHQIEDSERRSLHEHINRERKLITQPEQHIQAHDDIREGTLKKEEEKRKQKEKDSIISYLEDKLPSTPASESKFLRKYLAADVEEITRHSHEQALLKRLNIKERGLVEKEMKEIQDYLFTGKMPKSQQKKIRQDRALIHEEINKTKEQIKMEEKNVKAEIHDALKEIRKHKLAFKPGELVQKEEHLLPPDLMLANVEHVFEMISEAKNEMFKLKFDKAKNIYVDIMRSYTNLKPSEKQMVYIAIKELYEERKKAERLFKYA